VSVDERIRLIIEAENRAGEALRAVQEELKGVDDAAKKGGEGLSAAMKRLKNIAAQATAASGILVGFGLAARKAFAMAREAAEDAQLERSFERLMELSGLEATEVLRDLRQAVHDTVGEVELMAAANMLLAGTQGELRKELAASLPRLAAIAEAAHRLNPALGDTTYLLESLATGIKRGSPLLLDNLGITISLSKAYRDYAEAVGKSVDALTEEEKKIALLHGVLEQGAVIMEQAGDASDDMVGAFARAEVAIDRLGRALKEKLIVPLGRAADGFYWLLEGMNQVNDVYMAHEAEVRATAESYEAYVDEMLRAAVVAGKLNQAWVNMHRDEVLAGRAAEIIYERLHLLRPEMWEALRMADELGDGFEQLAGAAAETRIAIDELQEAHHDYAREAQDLAFVVGGPLAREMESYQERMGRLQDELRDVTARIEELRQKQADGTLWGKEREELERLLEKQKDLQDSIAKTAEAHEEATKRILFSLVQQRLAIDGLSEAEFNFLWGLAAQWDLVDQASLEAAEGVNRAVEMMAKGASWEEALAVIDETKESLLRVDDAADDAAEAIMGLAEDEGWEEARTQALALKESIEGLPKRVDISINLNVHGSLPKIGGGGGGWRSRRRRAPIMTMAGGTMIPGAAYIVGEIAPEVVVPTSSAEVRQVTFHNNFFQYPQVIDGQSILRELQWLEWVAHHGT